MCGIYEEKLNPIVCQLCFDEFACAASCEGMLSAGDDKCITHICHETCPAVVCKQCIGEYFHLQVKGCFLGMLSKIQCPVCLTPMHRFKWTKLVKYALDAQAAQDLLSTYRTIIESTCEMRCPDCDNTETLLPEPSCTSNLVTIPRGKKKYIPELRRKCQQFCLFQITAMELINFAEVTFTNWSLYVIREMIRLIFDHERRATLFCYFYHLYPHTFTLCCGVMVCFNCKTAGHHEGTCQENVVNYAVNFVVKCPGCHIQIVKGDGCDSVKCVCGFEFLWDDVMADQKFNFVVDVLAIESVKRCMFSVKNYLLMVTRAKKYKQQAFVELQKLIESKKKNSLSNLQSSPSSSPHVLKLRKLVFRWRCSRVKLYFKNSVIKELLGEPSSMTRINKYLNNRPSIMEISGNNDQLFEKQTNVGYDTPIDGGESNSKPVQSF